MIVLTSLFFFLISLIFRAYGFFQDYPFWVDEFSAAVQSKYVLKYGLSVFSNPDVYIEHHNIPLHFITAGLFQILGQHEWVARLPSVIFGSMIPVLVFFLGRYFFNSKTGLSAGLLTAFSYLQITWSRQARSYVVLQFITLLTIYLYFKIFQEKKGTKKIHTALLVVLLFCGFITHSFFYVFILSLIIDLLISHQQDLKKIVTQWWPYIIVVIFFIFSLKIGLFDTFLIYLKNGGFGANNLWYYHAFLWREYGLVTFLFILGFLIALFKKNKFIYFLSIYSFLHLVFITFVFKPYSSRYVLPIYPFMLMMMGHFISEFSELLLKQRNIAFRYLATIALTFFIILNGHKFVNRPKKFYSVNHDFRDIALIDYTQVYDLIKKEGSLSEKKTAVIETWPARTYWYLGIDYKPTYIFKWKGNVPYDLEESGEKLVPRNNNVRLIEDITDLKKVIHLYPKGYIFIDDSTLPKDVINYAEKNLKKELYLDHYPLDDNPYSIWPATLYSWGIK